MRRWVVISLLALHILGNTEMCQLISVPRIFEHFHLHQLMNPKTGFMEFIAEHYFGDDGIRSDDFKDRELPFMHFSNQTSLVATTPPQASSLHRPGTAIDKLQKLPVDISFFMPGYKGALLRPPRTC